MITISEYTKKNFQDALKLDVFNSQKKFVPSILESLAFAYIKPWDECFDPYLLYASDELVGAFYISYTPSTHDDYWIGGFFIDKNYQNRGIGREAFREILTFIKNKHTNCLEIQLTVEQDNVVAQKFYESFGFVSQNELNPDGEIKYSLKYPNEN